MGEEIKYRANLIAGWAQAKFHIMRLDRYFGPFMFVVMGAEVITVCFLLFFIIREGKQIHKKKKEYFNVSIVFMSFGELQ